MHVHVRLGLVHAEDVCNASTVRLNLAPWLFNLQKNVTTAPEVGLSRKRRVHPRPPVPQSALQPAVT
jgi:hypothetical protein